MRVAGRRKQTIFTLGKGRCEICNCKISDHEFRLFKTCDFWKCRADYRHQQRVLKKEREQRERLELQELKKRMESFRHEQAQLQGIVNPELFVPIKVPASNRSITSFPTKRYSALHDYLSELISEALKENLSSDDSSNNVKITEREAAILNPIPLLEQACAICQGDCCCNGGQHEYLNVDAIFRFLHTHHVVKSSEILASYLSYVPPQTYADSCPFHSRHGCSLPREMRSNICNTFECTTLRRLREEFSDPGQHRLFLVALRGKQVLRTTFTKCLSQ